MKFKNPKELIVKLAHLMINSGTKRDLVIRPSSMEQPFGDIKYIDIAHRKYHFVARVVSTFGIVEYFIRYGDDVPDFIENFMENAPNIETISKKDWIWYRYFWRY